jgi:N-acetylneuraminic acid mutarotase
MYQGGPHSNRMILDVSGTVADIQKALHVNMLVYQHPTEARTFFAPNVDPSLDLSVPLQGIDGLNNYASLHPNSFGIPLGNVADLPARTAQTDALNESGSNTNGGAAEASQPSSALSPSGNSGYATPLGGGSGPGGQYWGWDFRAAYASNTTLTGSNQLVGLIEFDGYNATDITDYEDYLPSHPLPNIPLTNVLIDGFNGDPSGTRGSFEVTLDIDMAVSMAPGLSGILVYEAPYAESSANFHDMLCRMADDNLARQLSCSWSLEDTYAPDLVADGIFQQMAAQGQSFFCASGDNDAILPGGTIGFQAPEGSPYITVVGGTSLQTSGPQGYYESEAVWNWNYTNGCADNKSVGSTGGISTNYLIPSWQSGISMTYNLGSSTMRNVPDVSLTADEILVISNGVAYCGDGTSCAAPLWAAFAALANQQAGINSNPPIGFLNPTLYSIGQGSRYSSDFHDITIGNNISEYNTTYFPAVAGYDLCTGWGTPSGQDLINDLSSAGSCSFTIASNLNTARRFQTAVLLPNGLVLAAGGYGSSYLSSAEIYNPANGEWTNTRSMGVAVTQQRGLLLPNGLVLIAGGQSSSPLTVTNSQLFYPESATWTNTGPLNTPREYHTLTLLPNGLVLAAGGANLNGEGTELSSAELYSPATGTWENTNSMSVACQNHTATLLPNGLVLVAGGLDSGTALTNAQLYNPGTGTWTNTGPLNTARAAHTATLLPNGLVLVVGGENSSDSAIANAELYNPATGTWNATDSMNVARFNHTATLLPSGTVLVTGGDNGGVGISDAEVYDSATGTWSEACTFTTGRWGQSATVLPDGAVLVAGGYTGSADLSTSELYPAPPDGSTFAATTSMDEGRSQHTVTLLPNGLLLAAGGFNPNGSSPYSLTNADLYNPSTDIWTPTGPLNTPRRSHTANLLPNGEVLVAGGYETGSEGGSVLPYAELYNSATGTWQNTVSMNANRVWHASTLLPNGQVLVDGGYNGTTVVSSAELYNPAADSWSYTTNSMNCPRIYHTSTLLPNGFVLIAGGEPAVASNYTNSAELYNPATGEWSYTGSMNTARALHTATLLPSGYVLVTGGVVGDPDEDSSLYSVELYNPFTGTWAYTNSMNSARTYHTAALLPTGYVLVAGGVSGGSGDDNGLSSAELYNIAAGTWAYTGSMSGGRYQHAAALLPNGVAIEVAGGFQTGFPQNGDLFYP